MLICFQDIYYLPEIFIIIKPCILQKRMLHLEKNTLPRILLHLNTIIKLKSNSQQHRDYAVLNIFHFSDLHYCPIATYSYDSFVSN